MNGKRIKGSLIAALTLFVMIVQTFTAVAGTLGVDTGRFTDWENLTWTTWDGVSTTYGRGATFSEVHPEIDDPEYYLKDLRYSPEVMAELKVFVNSFDWIHSDELTRANMVHDRISNGYYGNIYHYPESINHPVLMTGKGQCRDFSGEFKELANFVGLECEVYTPSDMHQACLVKINGQWFATDPTTDTPFLSNATTYPVEYETEYYRWEKETEAKMQAEEAQRQLEYAANPDSIEARFDKLNKELSVGNITNEQYSEMYKALTLENMNAKLAAGILSTEDYNEMYEYLK